VSEKNLTCDSFHMSSNLLTGKKYVRKCPHVYFTHALYSQASSHTTARMQFTCMQYTCILESTCTYNSHVFFFFYFGSLAM